MGVQWWARATKMSPTPALFSLPEARTRFTKSTREALNNKNIKPLLTAFSQLPGSENEKKCTLDQAFRGVLEEEGEMGDDEAPTTCSIPIDYNLYRKFWSLQDYFRNPVQCYEKISWKTFLKYSEEVLAVFKSYKLDDTQASRKKMEELKTGGEHVYFAKFLTSEKLMDLQLSDSNFRRHILLQYLILFQYLKGQVKFKSSNYVLTDEQSLWIEDTTKSVYQLLSENPPDGERFSKMVEHILNTEENWNSWKELPPPSEEIKTGEDEDEEDNDALLKENESPDVRRDKPITGEQIESFANKLGEQWKILAPYLEIKDSDIRQIECDSEDMKMRAKQLLVAWQDQEGVHATTDNLISALNKSGLSDLAESLTNDTETNS